MTGRGESAKVRSSLRLWGDGDEAQMIDQLERLFAFKFGDDELRDMRTVGDVEDAIWRRLSHCGGQKCMSAMAFYELRRRLQQYEPACRISPSDLIAPLVASPKDFASALKNETGMLLDLHFAARGAFGHNLQLGWLVALGAAIAGYGMVALVSLALALGGIVLMIVDRGRLADDETVGDVAKQLAKRNYGFLARIGGSISQQSVCAASRAAMAEFQGFHPEEIGRDTLLLGPKKYLLWRG